MSTDLSALLLPQIESFGALPAKARKAVEDCHVKIGSAIIRNRMSHMDIGEQLSKIRDVLTSEGLREGIYSYAMAVGLKRQTCCDLLNVYRQFKDHREIVGNFTMSCAISFASGKHAELWSEAVAAAQNLDQITEAWVNERLQIPVEEEDDEEELTYDTFAEDEEEDSSVAREYDVGVEENNSFRSKHSDAVATAKRVTGRVELSNEESRSQLIQLLMRRIQEFLPLVDTFYRERELRTGSWIRKYEDAVDSLMSCVQAWPKEEMVAK